MNLEIILSDTKQYFLLDVKYIQIEVICNTNIMALPKFHNKNLVMRLILVTFAGEKLNPILYKSNFNLYIL